MGRADADAFAAATARFAELLFLKRAGWAQPMPHRLGWGNRLFQRAKLLGGTLKRREGAAERLKQLEQPFAKEAAAGNRFGFVIGHPNSIRKLHPDTRTGAVEVSKM